MSQVNSNADEGLKRAEEIALRYGITIDNILIAWTEFETIAESQKIVPSLRAFEIHLRIVLAKGMPEIKYIEPLHCKGLDPLNPYYGNLATSEVSSNDHYSNFKSRILSISFISWSTFLIYQMTGLKGSRDAELWGLSLGFDYNDDGGVITFILFTYLLALYRLSPSIDKIISEKIQDYQKQAIFHGIILTLFLIISSFFNTRGFDLVLKLGCIGSIALIQWFLHSPKTKDP